ncbi:MAG: TspO/MBR family protein [Pseudomonadota bacterium]
MELASKEQLRASYLRWAVVTVPFVLILGLTAGRLFPTGRENAWYNALIKPAETPPDWAFPVAWTSIYVLMGLALAMIVNARGSRLRGPAIGLFAAQLAVNLAWSPLFFGAHQVFWSVIAIVVMLILGIATAVVFGRIRTLAAWLLVPYLVWISYAGVLTWRIDQLNPNAESLVAPSASTQIML